MGATPASFEPAIDYVVTKIPRFAFEKFPEADAVLTTQMKSVGETMAIGRTFKESLQKALRSLETGRDGLGADGKDEFQIEQLDEQRKARWREQADFRAGREIAHRFHQFPRSVAIDRQDNLYVADIGAKAIVVYGPDRTFLRRSEVEIDGDDLIVHGKGRAGGGGTVATHMDHRIAMACAVAALRADGDIEIENAEARWARKPTATIVQP